MYKIIFIFFLFISIISKLKADVRVKDIAHVKGISSNQLIGYGVVIGLARNRRLSCHRNYR